MKIAFLIIAYDNPDHLFRLVQTLKKSRNFGIFIHIDKKCKYIFPNFEPDIYVEKNPVKVDWGDYNFIEAVNKLLSAAIKNEYDRYCLISGTDYPLVSNEYIEKFFIDNDNEYINLFKMPENNKSLNRIYYYRFRSNSFFTRTVNLLNRLLRVHRKYPKKYQHYILYAGSTWWALTKSCVKYILDFNRNEKSYNTFYKHTYNPDKMYFHTIIGNSHYRKKAKHVLTYTDWSKGKAHPAILTSDHFKNQKVIKNEDNTPYLFARKFTDYSKDVLSYIDTTKKYE